MLQLHHLLHYLRIHELRLKHLLLALLHLLHLYRELHLGRYHLLWHHRGLNRQTHDRLLGHHEAHRHRLSGKDRVTHDLLIVSCDELLYYGQCFIL